MSKSFSVDLSGDKELSKALKKASNLSVVEKVVKRNTAELQTKAMRKAGSAFVKGYSTGATKRGIAIELNKLEGTVWLTMEYNEYTELGTRYMAPEPILIPSLKEQQLIFLSDLKKEIGG
ncbi:phage head-tail joining protein [Companilactobacillus sp. RD055328]|uniref:phage tail protein n=1 Tax=Companilactobacillus sp. RD055328 TaxID=2916634 RepID=UPI001FC7E6C3|nr:phage tail protein [Companilactobacillus sp. RD055328]GKQ42914.1 phage head-tail joining protein [Companilactobacillus sp. RD055328]